MSGSVAPHKLVSAVPVENAVHGVSRLQPWAVNFVADFTLKLTHKNYVKDLFAADHLTSVVRLPSALCIENGLVQNDVFAVFDRDYFGIGLFLVAVDEKQGLSQRSISYFLKYSFSGFQ
jgi:hypothetical protein